MLPSLELTVNFPRSRVYKRLLLVIYLLSILFILNSSFYWLLQALLICSILFQFKVQYSLGKPHPEFNELRFQGKQWHLTFNSGKEHLFDTLSVLIHNPLFQLIRLSQPNKNKLIILFNDQLSSHQLRLLHLNSLKSSI